MVYAPFGHNMSMIYKRQRVAPTVEENYWQKGNSPSNTMKDCRPLNV